MNYSNDDAWVDEMLLDLDDEMFTESDDESDDEARRENDDDIYGESEDDTFGAESDDDAEFLEIGGIRGVGKAISGIRGLINKKGRSAKKVGSFKPRSNFLKHSFQKRTPNINGRSNLTGTMNTNRGPFNFKLPPNIATKEDIKKLTATFQVSDKKQEAAIKQNAEAIKGNVAAIRKTNADLLALDKKHSTVELRQNKILETVNKSVLTLKKESDQVRQQMQMQAMMSMLMQPKLETLKLKAPKVEGAPEPSSITYTVEDSKFKSDMLPMIMMMSMSGGSGSSDGNMMNNPMMLYFLMGK